MDTTIILIVVIGALLIVAGLVVWSMNQKKQSELLRDRFGPEYERAVSEKGQTHAAEKELRARTERVGKLRLKGLAPTQQQDFSRRWQTVQAHFVDEPEEAIGEADDLVQEVMTQRGYPLADFEQQAADISVDHPEVVSNYRAAHAIAQADEGEVDTENWRQAMLHYRALFEDLLTGTPSSAEARR